MTDIVERLHKAGVRDGFAIILKQNVDKAADEIKRLRADAQYNQGLYFEARAEIERLQSDRARLIALLVGAIGETEERVAEWLRGRGYTRIHKPRRKTRDKPGARKDELGCKVDAILGDGNHNVSGCDIRKELEEAGYAVVPREPTEAMLDAGRDLQSMGDERLNRVDMRMKWNAMLGAL